MLVLLSCVELSTTKRIQKIEKKPISQEYEIKLCFALTNSPNIVISKCTTLEYWVDNINPELHEMTDLMENEPFEFWGILSSYLDNEIDNFKPIIFLVHTGIAYNTDPNLFIKIIGNIKHKYEYIKFGIENYDDLRNIHEDLNLIFENDDEIKKLLSEVM